MEENQVQNNLNQQPVQQAPQVQQEQVNQNEASVSMQIQQLLVQQQQYQQQYNQLVDYVKKTPNLPIEQVNQIKVQLDQLNALFVEWKQKLQALGYTSVQVNKPTEVKKWTQNNFSFKKLAIWCGIVLLLLLAWMFATLFSLLNNPNSLLWLWVNASTAKTLLQIFFALIFWSVIILMVWVIIANIYRLITVQNQSKGRFILGLLWWIFWAAIMWVVMWAVFNKISQIQEEVSHVKYDVIQPYLVWIVNTPWEDEFIHPYDNWKISWMGEEFKLIAPAEMAFSIRWNELTEQMANKVQSPTIMDVTLSCWNWTNKDLTLMKDGSWYYIPDNKYGWYKFQGTCLYSTTWEYTYSINVTYYNNISKETRTSNYTVNTLKFDSAVAIYKTSTTSSSSNNKTSRLLWTNWEFILWQAPAKITVDSTQVFRDYWLWTYNTEWDMDGDSKTDRTDLASFDYSYKIPQVYYVNYKFPWLSDDTWYRFPVRVEQSDKPVCWVNVERFPWTTKFQISTDFVDASSAATISSYNYTIQDKSSKKTIKEFRNWSQEFTYEFPEKWNYVVILDYVTIDWKQWQCESDLIQLEKETFNVDYTLLAKDSETWKFKEVCNAKWSEYSRCRQINIDTVPQKYHLQIKSITPSSNTTKKVVYLWDTTLLNEDDVYEFDIPDEWTYILRIVTSDAARWMEEETVEIKFIAKKPNIIWNMTIISNDTRLPVSEWFEPLTVILDASKTEINVPWDEIVYFTWDFGDWEIKRNQQNWVVAHTYNFDYLKENWIFQPKVTITTKEWLTDVIYWPKLNVKKWLINVELSSVSHPSRQAPIWKDVTFSAEFDGLPEKMIWDFGDWTPTITCPWRTCSEVIHAYKETWLYSVKLSLEFDAVQQVDGTMDFKVY